MDPTLPMLRLPYDKKSFPSFTYSRRTIFWRNVAQYETRELRRNRILPWAVVHNQNEPHKKKKKDHHSLRCRNRFVSLTSWLFDSDPIWLIRIPPGCSSTRKLHQKPTCGPWPITRGFFLFFFFFFHIFSFVFDFSLSDLYFMGSLYYDFYGDAQGILSLTNPNVGQRTIIPQIWVRLVLFGPF